MKTKKHLFLKTTFLVTVFAVPSMIMTLMVPYFALDSEAALPQAFGQVGWYVAEYVISAGALCSLLTR